MNIYKIKNTYWYQDELEYVENEKVNEIIKDSGIDLSKLNETDIRVVVDKLYEGDLLKRLFNIVLKPYNKGYRRIYNIIYKSKIPIVERMTNTEISEVLLDFFLYKASWLMNLINSAMKSDSMLSKMTTAMNSQFGNQSTPLQVGTSQNEKK